LFEVIKVADLPVAAIVRIAKKSGAKRVGRDAAMILSAKAEDYIAQLTKEANKLAIHAGRKTLKEEDVELAAMSA
jgi:histone H3/H4